MKILIVLMSLVINCLAGDLTITVKNLSTERGSLRIALWDQSNGFPKNHNTSIDQVSIEALKNASYTFENLKPGTYAFAIFHDINNDENLNTNAIGIPSEPFGFSNNPRLLFGPPSFRKSKFKVNNSGVTKKDIYLKSF